jgi:hypothetical protein
MRKDEKGNIKGRREGGGTLIHCIPVDYFLAVLLGVAL